VNAQLTATGHDVIYSFNHDVQRLPDGGTAVIGLTERTVNINGTPTNYVGMMVIVLNADFHVTWAWDAFEHLDVNRGPVLGEVLQPGSPQPTASVPRLPAVDWLHINAVSWSPADGNLVLSIRHQDWVLKIDYRNGAGDGHVIWRLGQGGDFSVNSTDPNPWFSHQHNAHYIDDHTLILFDNGNTRRANDVTAHSRGQVWTFDEQTMTATLVVNADLGSYCGAAILDPGAIELRRQDGSLVGLHADISILDGKTVAVLIFVGTEFVGGSLADGSYTLTVRADRVHDRWGRQLDGDGDGTVGGDRVDGFFRLFGDSDGDRDVDWQDRDLFRSAVGKSATDAGFPTVPRSVGRPLPAQLQPRPELPRRHKPSGRADGRLQRRRPAGPRGRQHLQQHGQRAAGQRRRHVPAGAELRHRRRPALSR